METKSSEVIVTEAQRVPAWAMVRAIAARRGLLTVIGAGMVPAAALAVGLVTGDLRWGLVALMLLFVVAPMALLLVYFSYALRPEVARAVLPHRLVIEPGRQVTIEYLAGEDDGDTRRLPPDETVSWERVTLLKHTPAYWLLLHD